MVNGLSVFIMLHTLTCEEGEDYNGQNTFCNSAIDSIVKICYVQIFIVLSKFVNLFTGEMAF